MNTMEILKNTVTRLSRNYYFERVNENYRREILQEVEKSHDIKLFKERAESLLENGFLILDEYFKAELPAMKKDFESILKEPCEVGGEYNSVLLPRKYLSKSEVFSRIGFDMYCLYLIRYYWGRKITLAQTHGLRIDPATKEDAATKVENSASIWHDDGNGKQVKMFVLLTDVTENDQGTEIIPKTNKLYHNKRMQSNGGFSTLLTDEEAAKLGKAIQVCAKAGSAVIFDTNTIHRASRKENGKTRDAWIYYYTSGRYLFNLDYHPNVRQSLTAFQRQVGRIS